MRHLILPTSTKLNLLHILKPATQKRLPGVSFWSAEMLKMYGFAIFAHLYMTDNQIYYTFDCFLQSKSHRFDSDFLHFEFAGPTILLDKPDPSASEPYSSIRTKLDLIKKAKKQRVIAIATSFPNEGKSYNSVNIASSYARYNGCSSPIMQLNYHNIYLYIHPKTRLTYLILQRSEN